MHLAQHCLEIAALGKIITMRAMAAVQQVFLAKRRTAADGGRLLPDHQVNRCFHLVLAIAPFDFLFDQTDAQHLAEQANEEFFVVPGKAAFPTPEAASCIGVFDHSLPLRFIVGYSLMRTGSPASSPLLIKTLAPNLFWTA